VIPRLQTERLLLREWLTTDREPFARLNADPRVVAFLSRPLDRAGSDELIDRIEARWASDGLGLWAVERSADGAFLGFVGLASPMFDASFTPCVEIGWRMDHAAWGHGYATEAAREALRFGFEELGLDEIVSFTVPQNERSWRVMERIGLVRDPSADFDHPGVDQTAYPHLVRHVLYRLRRDDWRRGLPIP